MQTVSFLWVTLLQWFDNKTYLLVRSKQNCYKVYLKRYSVVHG